MRTIQNEINELKKQVKSARVTPEGKPLEGSASPVEVKIQQLTEVSLRLTCDLTNFCESILGIC